MDSEFCGEFGLRQVSPNNFKAFRGVQIVFLDVESVLNARCLSILLKNKNNNEDIYFLTEKPKIVFTKYQKWFKTSLRANEVSIADADDFIRPVS